MLERCEKPFEQTLKYLQFVFGECMPIQVINKEAKKNYSWDINDLARQEGFASDLDYLRNCFQDFVIVKGQTVQAIPEKLYATSGLRRVYNQKVREKNPNAQLLSVVNVAPSNVRRPSPPENFPPRENRLPSPLENLPPRGIRRPLPPSYFVSRFGRPIDPSERRVELMSINFNHFSPEISRLNEQSVLERSFDDVAMNRSSNMSGGIYSVPPPGFDNNGSNRRMRSPPGFEIPLQTNQTRDATRREVSISRTFQEPGYPIELLDTTASEANPLLQLTMPPSPIEDDDEILLMKVLLHIDVNNTPIEDMREGTIVGSRFKMDICHLAQRVERVTIADISMPIQQICAKKSLSHYVEIIFELSFLAPYSGTLSRALNSLSIQIATQYKGESSNDLVQLLKHIPRVFRIFETENGNIPVYGLTILGRMTRIEVSNLLLELMPVLDEIQFAYDTVFKGIVVKMSGMRYGYTLISVANTLKYNEIMAELETMNAEQHVNETYPFMSVVIKHNNVYYRGCVLSGHCSELLTVELIDYGGIIELSKKHVFPISPHLAKLDRLALPASCDRDYLLCEKSKDKPIEHVCSQLNLLLVAKTMDAYPLFTVH